MALFDRRTDIQASPLNALSWDATSLETSLKTVNDHVAKQAQAAINWYLCAKKGQRRGARWLRVGALVAGTVAAILPALSQIYTDNGVPKIPPAWATIILAIAAGLVGLDHFFGCSSAWIRYITTELAIRRLLQDFEINWEIENARRADAPPSSEQVQGLLARCKTFLTDVNAAVAKETTLWATDFQSALKTLDEAAKVTAAIQQSGAVMVTVTNGDAFPAGWSLAIDDGTDSRRHGKTAAVPNLTPGIHAICITAEGAQGQAKRAEGAVQVPAGGITTIEMTLH